MWRFQYMWLPSHARIVPEVFELWFQTKVCSVSLNFYSEISYVVCHCRSLCEIRTFLAAPDPCISRYERYPALNIAPLASCHAAPVPYAHQVVYDPCTRRASKMSRSETFCLQRRLLKRSLSCLPRWVSDWVCDTWRGVFSAFMHNLAWYSQPCSHRSARSSVWYTAGTVWRIDALLCTRQSAMHWISWFIRWVCLVCSFFQAWGSWFFHVLLCFVCWAILLWCCLLAWCACQMFCWIYWRLIYFYVRAEGACLWVSIACFPGVPASDMLLQACWVCLPHLASVRSFGVTACGLLLQACIMCQPLLCCRGFASVSLF